MTAATIDNLESSFRTVNSRVMLTPDELNQWVLRLESLAHDLRHRTALELVRLAARIHKTEPVFSTEAIRQLALLTSVAVKSRDVAHALFASAGLAQYLRATN